MRCCTGETWPWLAAAWPDVLAAAALVPATPLLVPAVAVGSAPLDALREAVGCSVRRLLAAGPDVVVIVGAAERRGPRSGGWDWRRWGVPLGSGRPPLPRPLAIGDWLLDDVGWHGAREHVGVAADEVPAQAAALGRSLVSSGSVALLVVGDGSARRDDKAPGHFDPRAEAFDRRVTNAVGAADVAALLSLESELAGVLMVEGRAPWQVLAGAASAGAWQAEVSYAGAPYGVQYLVASWWR